MREVMSGPRWSAISSIAENYREKTEKQKELHTMGWHADQRGPKRRTRSGETEE